MADPSRQHVAVGLAGSPNYGVVVGVNYGTITHITQVAQVVTSLHQLRTPLADFVGRDSERAALHAALSPIPDRAALAAICGMGGLGKTELALHVAHEQRAAYPDAQLMLSLRSSAAGPPRAAADVLRDAIRAFDPQSPLPDDLDALSARYRGLLGGRRVLVLLDDAPDDAAVRPFIPPTGCGLLVTSRTRLLLEGQGTVVDLSLFSREESRALLLDDAPRVRGDPALDGLLAYCGDLPLAVRVAAATLSSNQALDPGRYLARLADATKRMGALRYGDKDVYAVLGVGAALLEAVDTELARRWALLGVCPAPFEAATAASLWSEPDEGAVSEGLGKLAQRSLLNYSAATGQYRMHDLLRDVAAARRTPEDERLARLLHAAHYVAVARAADRLYDDGHESAQVGLRLFDANWPHIRAAAAWVIADPGPDTDPICYYSLKGGSILDIRLHPSELIAWCRACAAAARRLGRRQEEIDALIGIGNGAFFLGDYAAAVEGYREAVEASRASNDGRNEGRALSGLGNATYHQGHVQDSIEFYERSLAVARQFGDEFEQGQVLNNLGNAYDTIGDKRRAVKCYAQSLVHFRRVGNRLEEALTLNNLGDLYVKMNSVERGMKYLFRGLEIIRSVGDRRVEALLCWSIGEALAQQNQHLRAAEYMQVTVDYEREISHPLYEEDLARLSEMRELMNDPALRPEDQGRTLREDEP